MRTSPLLIAPFAFGCIAPIPLGAPCELDDDRCEAALLCTPLQDRAVCAPERGAAPPPPTPCESRSERLEGAPGRLPTAHTAADPSRARFGVLWSSANNVQEQGEVSFTLIDPRSGEPVVTTPITASSVARPFAQGLAYSSGLDRYAAVWIEEDALLIRILDGDGQPVGVVLDHDVASVFYDNVDLLAEDGGFVLYLSTRDQDPGPGFGAAGIEALTFDASGGLSARELLLDNAVYDGRTLTDAAGDVWFTYSEGNFVENHVSVGRIEAGELILPFAQPSTGSGVIGSQILPGADGPFLMWREQGAANDQFCLLSDCAATTGDAPFEPGDYGDGVIELVLREDGRFQVAASDRGNAEPFLLVFDPATGTTSDFVSLGTGDGVPRVSLARQADATLVTFTQRVAAGSNAHFLDLRVVCDPVTP